MRIDALKSDGGDRFITLSRGVAVYLVAIGDFLFVKPDTQCVQEGGRENVGILKHEVVIEANPGPSKYGILSGQYVDPPVQDGADHEPVGLREVVVDTLCKVLPQSIVSREREVPPEVAAH